MPYFILDSNNTIYNEIIQCNFLRPQSDLLNYRVVLSCEAPVTEVEVAAQFKDPDENEPIILRDVWDEILSEK